MSESSELAQLREYPIMDYLNSKGITLREEGNKAWCSSPFSRDSNWSFCVYKDTNSFFDWSTGIGGDVFALIKSLEQINFADAIKLVKSKNFQPIKVPNYKQFKENKTFSKEFRLSAYINNDPGDVEMIKRYAESRGIVDNYIYGKFYQRIGEDLIPVPAMMFVHVDEDGQICGAKFRKVNNFNSRDGRNNARFSARGALGFYTLEYIPASHFLEPVVFLVESETSANSLHRYLREQNIPNIVISPGGVASVPKKLPPKYKDLTLKIIIDYDGNEDLYQERLKRYNHLNGIPLKLILNKGEDINSLYCSKQMYKIETLIFN